MNNISEADVAAAFYQQMQLQHVQNTAAAVAAIYSGYGHVYEPISAVDSADVSSPVLVTIHES